MRLGKGSGASREVDPGTTGKDIERDRTGLPLPRHREREVGRMSQGRRERVFKQVMAAAADALEMPTVKQQELFDLPSTEAHGKTVESLRYSRDVRDDILRMFDGVLPESIMEADTRARGTDVARASYKLTRGEHMAQADPDLHEDIKKSFEISGAGVRFGSLSIFPQNIGKAVLLLYSKPGDVVVDPFAGHNSRMQVCVENGRHYVGFDISRGFMRMNEIVACDLREKHKMRIDLYCQDSRSMHQAADDSADFTLTSPPYYDVEYYGDEQAQLGTADSYEEFLFNLKLIMRENYRALKRGAFCVYFVNDFRRRGRFHAYHSDIILLGEECGFVMHDIMIVDLGRSMRSLFASQIVEQKILPKRHEYGLVFLKR